MCGGSAWKSSPVRFFDQILKDRDWDRSSQVERPRKTGLNRHQPVQCGFSRFFTVLRPVSTSFSLNRLITGLGPVLKLRTVEKCECNQLKYTAMITIHLITFHITFHVFVPGQTLVYEEWCGLSSRNLSNSRR